MIVLSFDPGRAIGHACIDFLASRGCPGGRPRIIALETIETAAAIHGTSPFSRALDILSAYEPHRAECIVAIETNDTYVTRERNVNPAPFINAARIGGELAGYARALGLRVVEVSAHEWRRAIVGKRTASDAEVKAAIGRIVDLPKQSNAHERDACGVALYAERFIRLGAKPAANVNLPKPWKPKRRRAA
jgi:Holliday junction resolvasome RuvABC endonuclease subunit